MLKVNHLENATFDELDQIVRAVWRTELRRIEPARGAREALLRAAMARLQGTANHAACDLPCRLRAVRERTQADPIDLWLARSCL